MARKEFDENDENTVRHDVEVVPTETAPKTTTLVTSHGNKETTDEMLQQMSFQDLVAEIGIDDANLELGQDQYGPILEDKSRLVGVPLIIVKWTFNPGKGGNFASMYIMTQNGDRFIVNDGSTGIKDQLAKYTERTGRNAMLKCDRGFSKSDYVNEYGPSTTFYIDTKLTA